MGKGVENLRIDISQVVGRWGGGFFGFDERSSRFKLLDKGWI